MLTRENEMLKNRIRELEKQVADLSTKGSADITPTSGPAGVEPTEATGEVQSKA